MTHTGADDVIDLHLSPAEAKRVVAALRQYEPYLRSDDRKSPAEQLAAVRTELESIMWKIELAIMFGAT